MGSNVGNLAKVISGAVSRKHTVEARSLLFFMAPRILKRSPGNAWSGVSFISVLPDRLTRATRSFGRDGPGESYLELHGYIYI